MKMNQRAVDPAVRDALASVRNHLSDIGHGNPLVNYKELDFYGVPRLGIKPVEAFTHLVAERHDLVLVPESQYRSPDSRQNASASRYEFEDSEDFEVGEQASVGETISVPSAFSKQELDKRLIATYYFSQASLLEQGAVTLYIAMGFMKWKLKADTEEVFSAPLLLIPVELQRSSISAGFRLKYSGDEVTPNFCLVELAKRLKVQMPQLPETRDIKIPHYFDNIRRAIANMPQWYVDADSVDLGLFSFSKMLMYTDLDPAAWPTGALLGHPTIATILGGSTFPQPAPQASARPSRDRSVNKHSQEDMPAHVLDADSSQIQAILEVQRGGDLVIQGPPGTGKSQTIVNVIANAVADNKTVLFVSEKLAALEVVKRRLEAVGLGAIVLEIHSNRTRRHSVFEQLRKTLDLRANNLEKIVFDQVALKNLRGTLNDYCSSVNEGYGLSGESPYNIYGSLLALDELFQSIAAPILELPEAATWTREELQKKRHYVEKLQAPLVSCGVPVNSPYWGFPAISISPVIREKIRQALVSVETSLDKLRASSAALSTALGGEEPTTWEEVNRLKETGASLLQAPPLNGIDLTSEIWLLQSSHIHEAIASGTELSEITKKWKSIVAADAWNRDITAIKKAVAQLKGKWLKGWSPQFADLKDDMAGLFLGAAPKNAEGLFAVADAIDRAQRLSRKLEDRGPLLAKVFGVHWRGNQSNWSLLRQQADWIELTRSKEPGGRLPSWLMPLTVATLDQSKLWQLVAAVQSDEVEYLRVRDLADSLLGAVDDKKEKEEIPIIRGTSRELARLQETYRMLAARIHELAALTSYLQAREECLEHVGADLVQIADSWEGAADHLLDFFEFARLSVLAEGAFGSRPALASFNAAQHNKCVEDFQRLDAASLHWSQSVISASHVERMLNATAHKATFNYLVTTSEMPNSQPPIRKLIAKAAEAIQVVKPVFMMSPSSVASFLPPGSVHFDLVVFDEASQLRPADALGAIARGKQTVVVGDNKQLPPTRLAESRPTADSDVDGNKLCDVESVLGLFCSRGARQQVLKWHYRSKHESLIAQSNNMFYDNQLIVFPAPDKRRIDVGLMCTYISSSSMLEGGSSSTSRDLEAAQLAKAVMRHAAVQMMVPPAERLSLGVATLTALQRDRVLEQVEAQRKHSPESEEFFNADQHELFFVKNLESVQGDERDVILISMGYGVAVPGSSHQALGPILREGGERRVNVLFTRARRRCEIFTTIASTDIIISEHSPSGLIAFKNFLQYAETGRINRPPQAERKAISPVEMLVADRIERLGYTVKKNVGLGGFLIDLAVVDPQEPDRYILGIMCDGPSYKSAQSSRDRDRLREETFKNMGWNLYRVWSTAWFQNLQREEAALLAVLQKAAPSKEKRPVEIRSKIQAMVNYI